MYGLRARAWETSGGYVEVLTSEEKCAKTAKVTWKECRSRARAWEAHMSYMEVLMTEGRYVKVAQETW